MSNDEAQTGSSNPTRRGATALPSEAVSGLYVDAAIPRFTREELIAEMHERFGLTDGAFRKWQEKGLVASPRHDQRWQRGRPGSEQGLWSDNDRLMVVSVLELRERHRAEGEGALTLANLGNYVVWSWVYFDGYVELAQARRALRTWTTPQLGGATGRARSRSQMTRFARQAIEQLAAPGVPLNQRIRVAQKISEKVWRDDIDGLRALTPDLAKVMDPTGVGRRVGAPGASVSPAEEIERLYLVHRGAQAVVTGRPALADDVWELARRRQRQSWQGYQSLQPHLRATSTAPDLFDEPTLGYQVARCSSTLLYLLGVSVIGQEATWPVADSH